MSEPKKSAPLFSKLRRAIENVKFLLSFNASSWILSSKFRRNSPSEKKRLSFTRRQPSGLLDCKDGVDYYDARPSFVLSRSTSSATNKSTPTSPESEISRSTSDASESDDIDRRAEDFIANFHRHIQMERQVSLQLRYLNGKNLERTKSN